MLSITTTTYVASSHSLKSGSNCLTTGGEANALTEEDPDVVVAELEAAHRRRRFDVLFCDETSSQSGRILPLESVARFCRENSVVLVVDGTQSCHLLFKKNKKEILDQVLSVQT